MVTSTPTPLVMYNEATVTPTPLRMATTRVIREPLQIKILLMSDRDGAPSAYLMEPDGSHIGRLTSRGVYDYAMQRQAFNGGLQLAVVGAPNLSTKILLAAAGGAQPARTLVDNGAINYDPAWAPDGYWLAFVSSLLGHDEIYLTNRVGGKPRPLTTYVWEWNSVPPSRRMEPASSGGAIA
jgi:Tol biopolymer transport system component